MEGGRRLTSIGRRCRARLVGIAISGDLRDNRLLCHCKYFLLNLKMASFNKSATSKSTTLEASFTKEKPSLPNRSKFAAAHSRLST